MIFLVKRLGLGLILLGLVSGLLLATESDDPSGPAPERGACLQHASAAVLDEGTAGVIEGLADKGFREGDNLRLTRYQRRMATSARPRPSPAKSSIGPYDLVITISTRSLQAVANANKNGQMTHVFGLVADPFSAGVGLDQANPGTAPALPGRARASFCPSRNRSAWPGR